MNRVDIFKDRLLQIKETFGRRGSEIPVPTDKVLLLDIDGTLIDKKYQTTDPRLNQTVQQLQSQGWTVGLSSDTPLIQMRIFKERFGMNGPLIAEKGAIVEIDGKVMMDEADVKAFAESRQAVENRLREEGIRIWRGNPVEALREGLRIEGAKTGEIVALINILSQTSLRFYVREVINSSGELDINNEITDRVVESIRDLYPHFNDMDEDLNHDFGLLIAARKKTTKRFGTAQLMHDQALTEVGMIGDSMTDFLGSDIAKHYAVGNAKDAFKEKADYVAATSITEGVVEILWKLAKASPYRRRDKRR